MNKDKIIHRLVDIIESSFCPISPNQFSDFSQIERFQWFEMILRQIKTRLSVLAVLKRDVVTDAAIADLKFVNEMVKIFKNKYGFNDNVVIDLESEAYRVEFCDGKNKYVMDISFLNYIKKFIKEKIENKEI